ncbi:MAG TPA: hypothetical protein VFH61_01205 [Thermoleophilia bacterium]|nr:hypothetical protein [Thermoleophilia bacterium]
MGKWQLLDYPQGRVVDDVPAAALRHLLASKPAYLLHDQVLFAMRMETQDQDDGVRERILVLEAVASIGDLGHWDLNALRERGPFRSSGLRLPSYEDAGATDQVAGLLTERAGQAFLDQVQDELHK